MPDEFIKFVQLLSFAWYISLVVIVTLTKVVHFGKSLILLAPTYEQADRIPPKMD
jgi:hypothetical protein